MSRYSSTERVGVNAVETLTLNELDWIFREQPITDMGIDAHIESVIEGDPTGRLMGVQIKTGKSHFTIKEDELVYYGSLVHLNYWLSHSLPVILVAHLPDTNETYWIQVNSNTAERTKKAWKISIPKTNAFDVRAKDSLSMLLEGTEQEIRTRNLFLHVENMRFLAAGGKLVIYTEEWVHKSLGRGPVKLIRVDPDGTEEILQEDFFWYAGLDIAELMGEIYPWASLGIDEEYYDLNFSESFYSIFTDAYIEENEIYPYEVLSGEVALYRLELSMSSLGIAFLEVVEYLEGRNIT